MVYKMLGFLTVALILMTTVINASPAPNNAVMYTGALRINGTVIGEQSPSINEAADDQLCCCNIPGCYHLCGCACGSPCYANSQLCWC